MRGCEETIGLNRESPRSRPEQNLDVSGRGQDERAGRKRETDMDMADQLNSAPLPFAGLMGLQFTRAVRDVVEAELEVRSDLCTAGEILHGGAIMAFADTLGAVATMMNLPQGATGTTTIESKTNFLGAAAMGSVVHARCSPLHRGRSTQVWQTELWIDSERGPRKVAFVSQTQMVLFPR